MGMKWGIPLIFLFSLGLGFLLVTQSAISGGQHLYVSADTLDYYATNLETEQAELEEVRSLLAETQAAATALEGASDANDEAYQAYVAALTAEYQVYQMSSGLAPVQGPGITIRIDDATMESPFSWDPNDSLVHDLDLLVVINELKYAGAEAISINGQRIVGNTSINCSGYTVRINGITYAAPFLIQAIGDSARMSETLIGPNGSGTLLQYYGLEFKVTVENSLIIPAYGGTRAYQYTEIVKEGEGI